MYKAVILMGYLLCHHCVASDVTWLKTDWPPHQITAGPHQEQGTFDLLQQLVVAQLPHLTHRIKVVNLPRLEQAFLQRNTGVCSFGSLFTETRAKSRWYSKAVAVLPGLAVHFRQSTELKQHPAWQKNGSMDMRKLAQDRTLTGAYQPNRFYPASVMDATRTNNFIPQEFTSQLNAASLLLSKRVDYVVEYPERMAFYLRQDSAQQQIQSLAIADAAPYVVSYITCSKNPQGLQLIEQINKALRRLWQQPEHKAALFRWVDDNAKLKLEQAYTEVQHQVVNGTEQ